MRLSAIDSIQHGLLNLRANWQLVIMQFLQTLAVTVVSILGLLPLVFALGFTFLRSVMKNLETVGRTELLERVLEAGLPLLVALLATLLIWTLAFVVYCYFQGGIFGTLASGERQAGGASGWQSYRVFSMTSFFQSAERLTWPVFWLVNLFVLIGLAVVAGVCLVLAGFFLVLGQGSEPVLIILGCSAFFLFVLFVMFISLWMQLALAELAVGTRGVVAATTAALSTVVRRLPGVALLLLLLLVSSIAMAIVLVPLSMVLEFTLRDRMGAYLTGQAVVTLLQWLLGGILTVTWSAALVALVTGEREGGLVISIARRPAQLLLGVLALACARALLPVESPLPAAVETERGTSPRVSSDSLSALPVRELPTIPRVVRVGLRTDQESIELPCCGADIIAVVGGRTLVAVEGITVWPAVEGSRRGIYRLQIAALRDEEQALQLARTVENTMREPTHVVFDAGTGLYRIRAGEYDTREAAEAARLRFNQNNFHDVWVASEQGALENPSLKVQRGDRAWVVPGRLLRVNSTSGRGIEMGDRTYRGDLLVYINDRGTLNLINEVSLDDYLRGVVPREMGPKIFDNLDALKAQAVAARTYTLKNLGEFSEEGYDICATPRCQVYGGMTSEDPLSDQAVLETSTEVLLHDGYYADALYSSTCGGHTENVEVVFPLKTDAYLRGVPCLEAGVDRLGEEGDRDHSLSAMLARRLAPTGSSPVPAADFALRVRKLARLAGLSALDETLASLERREVQRFLASQLGMALDAKLFVAPEDVPYLLGEPPLDWEPEDLQLAAYFAQVGLLSGPLDEALAPEVTEQTLFHLAVFLRLLDVRDVRYLEQHEETLVVRQGGEVHRLEFAKEPGTFRRQGQREEAAPLALLPGDRVRIYLHDGRVLAVRHTVDSDGVAYDRTSNKSTWTHYRSDSDLARRVAERYPGIEFRRFEVQGRGVSGRVSQVEILGSGDQRVTVRGLPIRWTFDIPDTLFTVRRLEPPGREGGWLFSGRGWGHGVGLCQVGSYGMAMRGHGYREILNHYYRGLELVKLEEPTEAVALGR